MSNLSEIEFAVNREPRCPCVLLLDTSYSMQGERINSLNEGLQAFHRSLMADELAQLRVDVAIITFDGAITVIQDFVNASNFNPPRLNVSTGGTAMGTGIVKAINLISDRKQSYKVEGIDYYRPWIFMITDGEPTDSTSQAAQMVREGEERKGFLFFAVGVEEADMSKLAKISVRSPLKLRGTNFREMFSWLSASMAAVSQSQVGDKVKLSSPEGWGEVEM
jgi:uncharacterized protein YegL